MRAATPLRSWTQRVWRLGPSRLSLGLAVLFAVASLATPMWTLSRTEGNDLDVTSFFWTTLVTESYEDGAWSGTTILPYRSTTFPTVAGVLGTSYILAGVLILVLLVVLALFSMGFARSMHALGLLVVSLLVVVIGLLALLYPVVAIPGAATTDVGLFTVGGFWGSADVVGGPRSWGAGLGWWLLLVAAALGILGAVLPYLKSIRAMGPARGTYGPPT